MKTQIQSFESYLQTYWYDNEMEGQTKDQCETAEENWEEGLDVAEVIELAEKWGKELVKNTEAFKYDAQFSDIISKLERIEEAVVPPSPLDL